MSDTFIFLPPEGGGGGGAVDSVNGQTGVVVLTKSSIGLANVNNTSDANKPISTATQTALDLKQDDIAGTSNRLLRKANDGSVVSDETIQSYDTGEVVQSPTIDVEDAEGITSLAVNPIWNPTESAPASTVTALSINPSINDNGFELGTNGTAINVLSTNLNHQSTADIGAINLLTQNFNVGNGTDPLDVKGMGYAFGFGTVNANVTVSGPVQGYGFQPNLDAGSTMNSYVNAFYDAANIGTKVNGYQSASFSPNIAEIATNNNVTSVNINPTIDSFEGNASFNGLSVAGTFENFGTSGATFINVNPTANDGTAKYATGLSVSMDNVTGYAGVVSTLVFQDLTFTFNAPGDNNGFTVEYTPGATAGSEVVSIAGQAIEVQIDSGVSTALQIKAALEANPNFNSAVTVTVSGTGSNPQVTDGPDNFINGENVGSVRAAYLDGDVEITGALSFGGALSIGKLNAFASQALVDGGGQPSSIHSLITQPTVGDNVTLTSADSISVNTAALINIGSNSTVGTSFIGIAALGLPAVLSMGAGSTLDRLYASLFALSLDATAAGGTVDEMGLCRAVAMPNGVTTVNNLYGFLFDLPFGDPGTKTFGFYDRPGKHNYFAGDLLIGGTPGSDDVVFNSSVGLEIKSATKAFLNARMSTTDKLALSPVAGMQVFDETLNQLSYYNGTVWINL